MSFFSDVTSSVTSMFGGPSSDTSPALPLGAMPPMFGDFIPGGGSAEASGMAFPHYAEEPELPTGLMSEEDIERVNAEVRAMGGGEPQLPTGLMSEEQIAEANGTARGGALPTGLVMTPEIEAIMGGRGSTSQVGGDGSPPVAASTTTGDTTGHGTAVPPVAVTGTAPPKSAAVAAELGAIDWTTKGGLDTFRARLHDVPAAERAALLKSLPKESQAVGFTALQLATSDDIISNQATTKLTAANETGALDEAAIRSSMVAVPKEMRAATLATLPEDVRKQAQDQLAKDDAVLATNAGSVATLSKLDWKNPNAITGDARAALRAVPPEERAAVIANLPADQRAMAMGAITLAAVDDVKASTAATTLSQSSATLDPATIRAQLRDIPPEMRERTLASLPAEAKAKIAELNQKDGAAVEANKPVVIGLAKTDFTQPGGYKAAVATLASVPADQRAALIESLPAGQRACAGVAVGMLVQQEASASVGADMLKKASEAGVPDDKAIETSLALMPAAVREKALADLPEATRAAVDAKIADGKQRAADGAKILMTAGGDKLAVHNALANLPAWEKQQVLDSLSAEARAAADDGLATIEKCDVAKKAVEALATADGDTESTVDMDKALAGVPAELYPQMKSQLSPEAQARLAETEALHKKDLEDKLAGKDAPFGGAAFDGPNDERDEKEKLKRALAEMPAGMRDSIVGSMDEGDARDRATDALAGVKTDEKHRIEDQERLAKTVDASTKSFADLAAKPPVTDPDNPGASEDAQKQYDKAAAEALAKIPYKEREKAIAAMPPEAQAVAATAMMKKKEEMKGKAVTLFNAINAGMLANGTDTTTILQTLATLTPDERKELEVQYAETYKTEKKEGRDLESDLRKEFQDEKTLLGGTKKDNSLDRAFLSAVFSGQTAEQKAIALQLGARGSSMTDFTDEALLKKTLESIKDPKEREEAFRIFKERQEHAGKSDTDVSQMLRSETVTGDVDKDDYDYKQMLALSNGQFEAAKAVEVEEAMDPGMMGNVSVRNVVQATSLIPGSFLLQGAVELADKVGVIDADKKLAEPNSQKVAEIYATADSQTQRDQISNNFKDSNDGKSVQDVTKEKCTGKGDSLLVDSATKNDKVGLGAGNWLNAEDKANSDEQRMMSSLEGENGFSKKVIERIGTETGDPNYFENRSKAVMDDREQAANKELAEDGKVKPLTGLLAAAPKISTGWAIEDMDKHLHAKGGKLLPKAEAAQLRKDFCEAQGISEDELETVANQRFGGKDAFKFLQMMKGEPATAEERIERMKEEQEFNRGGLMNLPGKLLTDSFSNAGESQDAQFQLALDWQKENGAKIAALEEKRAAALTAEETSALALAKKNNDAALVATLEKKQRDALAPAENAQFDTAEKELADRGDYFGSNVKSFQTSRETIANDVTTLAAGTVGAIATVATGGTAGPLVGAFMSGLTTIASKTALLGSTYNERDRMKDGAQTAVNMAAAGAATGAGSFVDAITKGPGGQVLEQLAFATVKGTVTGAASGLVSSAGGVLIDEKTLQGKGDVADMAKKTALGTLSSAAGSGASALVGKGLDLGGLQSADPTKQFSAGGHAANKALSTVAGDGVGFVVDPANLQGPDVFGKFLQKEAMSLPGAALSAAGEYQGAVAQRRADAAKLLGIPESQINAPENQARIDSFEEHTKANPGFMEGVPLTNDEKIQKAQQDSDLKNLTKPADEEHIPIFAEDVPGGPSLQPHDESRPKGPLPTRTPVDRDPSTVSSPKSEVVPDAPDVRWLNEQHAIDRGCGPDTAKQAAAIAAKHGISIEEAIVRVQTNRDTAVQIPDEMRAKTDALMDQMNREADADLERTHDGPEITVTPWDPGMGSEGRPVDPDHVPGPGEAVNWGGDNGGIGAPSNEHLAPGTKLERKGSPRGGYFSPENTPIDERSLPPIYGPDGKALEYTPEEYFYEVGPKGLAVESNAVAPLFGKRGGGIQYQASKDDPDARNPNMQKLTEDGRLIETQQNIVREPTLVERVEVLRAVTEESIDAARPHAAEATARVGSEVDGTNQAFGLVVDHLANEKMSAVPGNDALSTCKDANDYATVGVAAIELLTHSVHPDKKLSDVSAKSMGNAAVTIGSKMIELGFEAAVPGLGPVVGKMLDMTKAHIAQTSPMAVEVMGGVVKLAAGGNFKDALQLFGVVLGVSRVEPSQANATPEADAMIDSKQALQNLTPEEREELRSWFGR